MYDWPEIAWATDALWSAVATRLNAAGIAAPARLERQRSPDAVWRDTGLVVSQTCGFPFSTRLRGIVRLLGAPVYDAPGCERGHYRSVIVARRGGGGEGLASLGGKRFAYNAADSLSGYLALCAAMKEAGLDPSRMDWIQTGSHRGSVRAVAEGRADVAAIDAVCWALAEAHEPDAHGALETVAHTPLRPGLPLVTAVERSDAEVAGIRSAVGAALADPELKEARLALRLVGFARLDEWDYAPIAALAQHAARFLGRG
jgi:ABC-type phosphate/phosphonate transport system substrate-binding protein